MIWWKHNSSYPNDADCWLAPLLSAMAVLSALILLLVLGFLIAESWPVLSDSGWAAFLMDESWYPLEGMFGVMPMLWSSLAIMAGAVLLALPLGLASALFERFYAPAWGGKAYRLGLSLLAGIPSVVYGLWGLTVLVPLIARLHPPGASLLAAMLVMALMILPTLALTSSAALAQVPSDLLAGADALGMTRQGKLLGVVLPAARGGIFGGLLLAIARALGETMVVLMVAGNVVQNPHGLFEPVRTLTANIALEMAYADGTHRAGLFASGLLLTLLVLLLAWMAARILQRSRFG